MLQTKCGSGSSRCAQRGREIRPRAITVEGRKHIVVNRKVGNQVFYSVRDRLILDVLDVMKRYFYAHLTEGQAMLDEIKAEAVTLG